MFIISDELHAEWIGEFPHREQAMAELHRLAGVPWDQAPNRAPCTGSKTCGRSYELVEYDDSQKPWRELSRIPMLDISAAGVRWL
jgi:hypothetical protein